jgi:hypothetical protein
MTKLRLQTSYNIQFPRTNETMEHLYRRTDLNRLLQFVADYFQENEITGIFDSEGLLCEGYKLAFVDNYYWIITHINKYCIGIFYNYMDAFDYFALLLLNHQNLCIKWDDYFSDSAFVQKSIETIGSKYYHLNSDFSKPWIKIETDLPEKWFSPDTSMYDRYGYTDGQKLIYEMVLRYLGAKYDVSREPFGTICQGHSLATRKNACFIRRDAV